MFEGARLLRHMLRRIDVTKPIQSFRGQVSNARPRRKAAVALAAT